MFCGKKLFSKSPVDYFLIAMSSFSGLLLFGIFLFLSTGDKLIFLQSKQLLCFSDTPR